MDEGNIRIQLRQKFSVPGWVLLVYYGILNLVVFVTVSFYIFRMYLGILANGGTPSFSQLANLATSFIGWGYLAASGIGCLALLVWKSRKCTRLQIFHPGNPMTIGRLIGFLCLIGACQVLNQLLLLWQQLIVQPLGIVLSDAVESIGTSVNSLNMFLYICLVAPVAEEILFRGVIIRLLEPYGKKFAILGSAFLFGIFHGNLIQAPFAFGVGLILGYVALEYGLLWSMVLHMFNNLVLGDTLPRLLSQLPGTIGDGLFSALMVVMSVSALLFLFFRRRKLSALWKAESWHGRFGLCFFTAPGIVTLSVVMWFRTALFFLMLLVA